MKAVLLSILLASATAWAQGPLGIVTIAGTPYDPSGDNGPATLASISLSGVAFKAGNLYLTDGARIRKIDPTGRITTIVGLLDPVVHQPIPGFSGDGGPALGAQLRTAFSLDFDSAGNLYIADGGNGCVRKVTARVVGGAAQPFDGTEIISTVVGVCTVVGNSGDGGPATSAKLRAPRSIAIDPASGTIYIADQNNNNVRKVDPSGTITTIAGTGVGGFSGDGGPATAAELNLPIGIAVDPVGNVYVADVLNNRLRKIDAGGTITTAAGTGALSTSNTSGPATTVNVTPAKVRYVGGILYIVDSGAGLIRKIDTGTGIITTVVGIGPLPYSGPFPPVGDGGPALQATLGSGPAGIQDVALDAANDLFIIDASTRRIRFAANPSGAATIFGQTVAAGNIATVAGPPGIVTFSGDGGSATAARLFPGVGIVFDPAGNLYFSDSGNNRVRRIDTTGIITTFAGDGLASYARVPGVATAAAIQPGVLAFHFGDLYLTNNTLRVLQVAGNAISVLANTTGTPTPASPDGTPAINAMVGPAAIVFDPSGNLYIGDALNFRIEKVDAVTGKVYTVAGGGTVVVDGVTVLSTTGTQAQLFGPGSIALDPSGNLYLIDGSKDRILKITAHGTNQPLDGTETVTIFAGTGSLGFSGDGGPATAAKLNGPGGLVTDAAGNIYFTDGVNFRIRKVDTNGIITTVAGTGVASFSGDGGPALSAQLRGGALAFDTSGNLYVIDAVNNVIRELVPLLTSGNNCNGTFTGTLNGDLNVSNGQTCKLLNAGVTGNITQQGGILTLGNSKVGGNVQIQGGGGFSIGPNTTIGGNLQIQSVPAGGAPSQVCGTAVHNDLTFQNNGVPVVIGSSASCAGNSIGGNLTVGNNTAATTVYGNTVSGNLQDQNNTAPTQVFNNVVGNNLQCQQNTSITGGGNTAKSKQGQCAAF